MAFDRKISEKLIDLSRWLDHRLAILADQGSDPKVPYQAGGQNSTCVEEAALECPLLGMVQNEAYPSTGLVAASCQLAGGFGKLTTCRHNNCYPALNHARFLQSGHEAGTG